jgi:hypothetical protein
MPLPKPIRILFYGSCWPTNIGNAFVNHGAIKALKQACGSAAIIHHFGGMSSYLFNIHGQDGHTLLLGHWTNFDYVVTGGMTQCVEHCEAAAKNLGTFIENGAKLIIAGGGGYHYDTNEVQAVREWMQRLPVAIFISRDRHSFENYADLAEHSYDGIDNAFFISEDFEPLPFNHRDFVVLNFDTLEEPDVIGCPATDRSDPKQIAQAQLQRLGFLRRLKRRFTARGKKPQAKPQIKIYTDNRRVIRTHHSPMWTIDRYFLSPNTLISDLPSDYLSIYAQAAEVHSDRVHACIAALSFGNRARFYVQNEPRLRMFARLGIENVAHELTDLDPEVLRREKQDQVRFLRDSLLPDEA